MVPVTIEEEMQTSYLAYAMSVIVSRALPDVRDGLKPVQPPNPVLDARERVHPGKAIPEVGPRGRRRDG